MANVVQPMLRQCVPTFGKKKGSNANLKSYVILTFSNKASSPGKKKLNELSKCEWQEIVIIIIISQSPKLWPFKSPVMSYPPVLRQTLHYHCISV
jgi:hypothetical protein